MGTDRVETIDGSAVEGEDYQPVNEILTFEPHEREKEIGYSIQEWSICIVHTILIFFVCG